MKRPFFAFTLIGLAHLTCGAATPPTAVKPRPAPAWKSSLTQKAPGSFTPLKPCRVTYNLSWNNIVSAGKATVTMQKSGELQVARAEASTTGLARKLWKYDCLMTSVIQSSTLRTTAMRHTETDSAEKASYQVRFDAKKVEVKTDIVPNKKSGNTTQSTTIYPYGPMDDLQSAILYVRSQPLVKGETITRVVQPFDRPYLATFQVLGRETRKIEGKIFPSIKLDIKIRKLDRRTLAAVNYKKVKTATIWISDDEWRLPVEAHADIFAGFISATLVNREELQGKEASLSRP